MRRAWVLGIAAMLLASLAACGGSTENTEGTTGGSAEATGVTTGDGTGPQGELVASIPDFGNENFLPWRSTGGTGPLLMTVYDVLVYWDEVNKEYIPGLAESWEYSPDGLTLTYHLREGVQFQDGWGELTSEDVKWNFEQQALDDSTGRVSSARMVKSMDTPDPYTLVVHFKMGTPAFLGEFSLAAGGTAQGIVCKKYVETVGEDEAAQKPVGTGPYKLVDSQLGSYYKFEAVDSHWRVVPEFKYLTVRLVQEPSTVVAMLKTGEVDCAIVSSEQLTDLEASGVNTEVSPEGGSIVSIAWGGMAVPEDSRYNPDYHNKDPWADMNVRKAMTISIDRQAICDAIFSGAATPVAVPIPGPGEELGYQYPYDPAQAKDLLAAAGYPDGFSFKFISFVQEGVNQMPRVVEVVASYWEDIGLDPEIVIGDFSSYGNQKRHPLQTAGEVTAWRMMDAADQLTRANIFLMPEAPAQIFMDEGSVAIIKEGQTKMDPAERLAYVRKLNQYYYENYGPIPICRAALCYAWSDKISAFPHGAVITPYYWEYVRHAEPLNTFRLFTPWPDR